MLHMLQRHEPKGLYKEGEAVYNHHLDTFLCAADKGSFSKAAEELYISPNAVMKQINLLERSLDLRLFIRDNHGLLLTPAGEVIYRETKAMKRRSDRILTQARALDRGDSSVIRVGSSLMRSGQAVVELWRRVQDQCPDIKLQIVPFDDRSENYRETLEGLGQEIDIIFGLFPSSLYGSQYNMLTLGNTPLCCAVPLGHPLAGREKISVSDLYGQQLNILRRGGTVYIDALRDELQKRHPQVEIIDVPDYDLEVLHQCEVNGGLLLTAEIWKDLHPSLVTVPVEWSFSVPYGLLYPKHPARAVERFIEALRKLRGIEKETPGVPGK